MGEQKVSVINDTEARRNFIDHLLKDIEALQKMLDNDMIETGITRIGAEK